ncbi:MAG: DUF6249 domain-containing protein [Candidatus Eisenbacteria bacterium]
MHIFDPDFVVPFLIFTIPIIAIVGGIATGIIRTMGRQRLVELAQQERIAAIQRGVDPAQLPPIHPDLFGDSPFSPQESDRRRHEGLLIGGIVTLFTGIGIAMFLWILRPDGERYVWAVGIIPMAVGLGLLLSAMIVRPAAGPDGPRV